MNETEARRMQPEARETTDSGRETEQTKDSEDSSPAEEMDMGVSSAGRLQDRVDLMPSCLWELRQLPPACQQRLLSHQFSFSRSEKAIEGKRRSLASAS